ncbi:MULTISPECIES: carboxyltransferase domain-containing protein [unclassified Gordonia (in: high G+C Gram-positive bacteria)]|uniref:5-oxoprolinase subunit B family protein n=1 Tax=unclassified Gordonia (in: high G+C Gram-positive bacteria) TaxID=2657482 RepID=UPI001F05E8CD|nr:carboxyltransferase domain-containing protein [Gordonia sp. PDNC005]
MPTNPAILSGLQPSPQRPAVAIRQAGDRQLLVEYGPMKADLHLNFRVQALWQILKDSPIDGVVDSAPGFRSLLITFDPARTSRSRVIAEIAAREQSAPDIIHLTLPSREVLLPIAFDDSRTREAVSRYRADTRDDAPNVSDGDNIDYIVRYNGFDDREEFISTFLGTTWWNGLMGYFPGLPSLFSMDPRTQLTVPKYNPARMWTPEGSVALGGPCVVLYPMEAPGSYQLFGRSIPMRATFDSPRAGESAEERNLLRVGDRVRFRRVTEEELIELRLEVFENRYRYDIVDSEFAVAEYAADVNRHRSETETVARRRADAAALVEVP